MEIGEPIKVAFPGANAADTAQRADDTKLRIVKVIGPARVEACHSATYKVVAYSRRATPDEKRNVRWEVRFADDSTALHDPGKRDGDVLTFDALPDDYDGKAWAGRKIRVYAILNEVDERASVETEIACTGMHRYIALVRKVERATGWNPDTVLNALRRLAGYDTPRFQTLYGLPAAPALTPTGDLTHDDISKLEGMSSHGVLRTGKEIGIVTDASNHGVAIGHVLTGLSGGQHRNRAADLRPWLNFGAGFPLDNLHAATLAGDIGQSAVEIHQNGGSGARIGPGSELTFAEAIGDIDGLLMGDEGGLKGLTVSERLHAYYCVKPGEPFGPNAAHRFKRFGRYVDDHLRQESQRFAVNYLYSKSKIDGVIDSTEAEVNDVLAAFTAWLGSMVKGEPA
ncbi:hypothetical protein A7982_12118 [Minicystis rosea]|nr:hypothetical protein A7982_12118 [Minicystis rosea]